MIGGENGPRGVDFPLASWAARSVGAIADGIIIGIPTYLIALGLDVRGRADYFYLDLVVSFVYSFALVAFLGHTLGMSLMRLQAVEATEGKSPIGIPRAAIRSATAGFLTIIPLGGIIDLLWPLWDPRNQTLHDKAAGTVVLRRDARGLSSDQV